MSFETVIARYRQEAASTAELGHRFERLMQRFLETAPIFKDRQFKKLWLWSDFPHRGQFGSGHDVGVDIVGLTAQGAYVAVQCKCWQRAARIDKASVDSFLATALKAFRDESGEVRTFSELILFSTSESWSDNAEAAVQGLSTPFSRFDLDDLASQTGVDWDKLDAGLSGAQARAAKFEPRPDQVEAIEACHAHFQTRDRGKLIMACGTGKTFTALRIAERELMDQPHRGAVLFLVPSIALLNQTLISWKAQATGDFDAICVCSDSEAGREVVSDEDEVAVNKVDLAMPPSTSVDAVVRQFKRARTNGIGSWTAIFSTYQSIEIVAAAQKQLLELGTDATFDLVICDEAHRTTGVAFRGSRRVVQPALCGTGGGALSVSKPRGRPRKTSINSSIYDESAFMRVHDNDYLRAKRRLYMTATPRLYKEEAKAQAKDADALLCSMDDPAIYGEEIFRLSFARAVTEGLLCDYRVLVLTVRPKDLPASLIEKLRAAQRSGDKVEVDDLIKLFGCRNALSKRVLSEEFDEVRRLDKSPMRRAIAFCSQIKVSRAISERINDELQTDCPGEAERAETVKLEARHIDGSMNATERSRLLNWLKSVDPTGNESRVLTNVRCLTEGVDVPALDAVLFLSPRSSEVDVVQAVGRVMRRAPGKRYGYIVIPVLIPEDREVEEILGQSDSPFRVVWQVLRALRSHDERLPGEINRTALNKTSSQIIVADGSAFTLSQGDQKRADKRGLGEEPAPYETNLQRQLRLGFREIKGAVYARMVKKVGARTYWEDWAGDVGREAERQMARIQSLIGLDKNTPTYTPPPHTSAYIRCHIQTNKNTRSHFMNSSRRCALI